MKPIFHGHCEWDKPAPPRPSYRRWGLLWSVPLVEYHNDLENPLTFRTSRGMLVQPDNHLYSDGGSIPPPLQGMPLFQLNPFRYPWSYYNHDSAYQYGGWYVCQPDNVFRFQYATRDDVDDVCLRQMTRAEGATDLSSRTIYRMVRLFGSGCWNEKKQALARIRDGI